MSFQNDAVRIQRALLDEALTKGIQRNEEQRKVWTAYKKSHQELAEALQSFQKDLYVNCMVPIGKRALMKGKLIHTNEVLACLGDGYFGKYSTAGATSLCERRIKKAEEMLENLNAEINLFETRLMVTTNDLLEDFGGKEIVEHWNDDQIAEWKRKHRERERDYHQKLAKLKQEERKKIETEEDLFDRLDQLEIEEELADEFNRLEDEKYEYFGEELEEGEEEEEEYYDDSESEAETKEEEEDPRKEDEPIPDSNRESPEKSPDSCKIKKSVSFAEPGDLKKSEDSSAQKETECSENQEDIGEDIVRIEFSHTENNPVIKSDGDLIESPADICRIFTKPKSILKRSPNDVNPEQGTSLRYSWVDEVEEEEEEEQEDDETIKPSAYETVVKDIKERSSALVAKENPVVVEEIKDTRPVSKFKRDRQLKR